MGVSPSAPALRAPFCPCRCRAPPDTLTGCRREPTTRAPGQRSRCHQGRHCVSSPNAPAWILLFGEKAACRRIANLKKNGPISPICSTITENVFSTRTRGWRLRKPRPDRVPKCEKCASPGLAACRRDGPRPPRPPQQPSRHVTEAHKGKNSTGWALSLSIICPIVPPLCGT